MDKKSKEILERFTQRLIDNNSRSRSYFLGVLKSTDTIDLYEYAKVFNGHFNLSLAINKHNKMDFPYQPIIPERISNTLIESKDFYINKKNTFFKEIIKHIPLINEKDSNTIYNNIENPDLENLVKDICLKYEDTFINKYRSLDTLLETSKAIERESARNDLYIGYPFIEGKFFNGKVFRGPLILHSVNIESYPHLKSIKFNDTIYLNPVFIISYLVENKMTHQRFDFELTASKDIIKSTIKFLKDRLALKIDVLDITALVPFKSCTKPFYEEKYALYPGEFKITNNAVIGIFPISSKSIYYDIKNITELDAINPLLKNFLSKHHKDTPIMDYFNQKEETETREEKIDIIGTADITQKMIIRESLSNNLVIQGPPGTGKSQTIVNMIAAHVSKGKNILVISEKKTAIDVIYNRLEGLADFSIIIRNLEKDKPQFYKQANNTLQTIKKLEKEPMDSRTKIQSKNKIINKFFANIHNYHDMITSEYDGYNFSNIAKNQKYSLTKENQLKIKHFTNKDGSFRVCLEDIFVEQYFSGYTKLKEELEKYQTYDLLNYNINNIERIKKIFSLDISAWSKKYLFHRVYYGLPTNNYTVPLNVQLVGFIMTKELRGIYKIIENEIFLLNLEIFKNNTIDYNDSELLEFITQNELTKEEIVSMYQRYLYDKIAKENKETLRFMQDYDANYDNVSLVMREKEILCQKNILSKIVKNIVKSSEDSREIFDGIKELQRLANLNRKKSIANVLDKNFESLRILYPIWLMTPEVASAILPVKTDIFDCLIFDEASQMFIENAVPAIYRAKKMIVAGDAKQLRPSSVFSSRYVEDAEALDSNKLTNVNIAALEEESLLDYASHKYMQKYLRYHYRSESRDLIDFSNRAFYNNQLFFANTNNQSYTKPLEVIQVINGLWSDSTNLPEALAVKDAVLKIIKTKNARDTIGIITFNEQQKKLIEDLLIKECAKNEDEKLRLQLQNEMNRVNEETGEDLRLFVKNIENVQGDERDIIIFSITYARNAYGKLNSNFGLLSMSSGENRLNVAITRAKKKIIIVKSFYSYELEINEKNNGPYYFKKYLEYAEHVAEQRDREKNSLLNSLYRVEENRDVKKYNLAFFDDLQEKLTKRIDKNKYSVERDIDTGTFNLDFGIINKTDNKIVLAIKGDADLLSNSIFERENDFYCDKYLMSRGWKYVRIYSSNWWKNANAEIKKILDLLNG